MIPGSGPTAGDPAIAGTAARELGGAEFFKAIIDGELPVPPITATLDFALVSAEPGRVVFEGTPAEFHYNPTSSATARSSVTSQARPCTVRPVSADRPAGRARSAQPTGWQARHRSLRRPRRWRSPGQDRPSRP
jgi:hypothetical protein